MEKNEKISGRHQLIKGVSLIEMCILLVGLSLMVGPAVKLHQIYTWNVESGTTTQTTAAVRQAIDSYYARNNRYPCPAVTGTGTGPDTSGFGQDSAINPSTGKPLTAGPGANCSGTISGTSDMPAGIGANNVRVGSIPTRALGLPDSDMLDGWGNRLVYAVTEVYAGQTASVPADLSKGGILINDAKGNSSALIAGTTNPAGLVYFVMAPGPDIRGAYSLSGSREAPPPSSSPTGSVNGSKNFDYEKCLGGTCTTPAAFVSSTSKTYNMTNGSDFTSTFSYMLSALNSGTTSSPPIYTFVSTTGTCNNQCPSNFKTTTFQCTEVSPNPGPVASSLCTAAGLGAGATTTTTAGCSAVCTPGTTLGVCGGAICGAGGTQSVTSICTNTSSGLTVPYVPNCGVSTPAATTQACALPACTYTLSSTWSACGGAACGSAAGAGTETATNTCTSSAGGTVALANCAGPFPTTKSCTMPACAATYAWVSSAWGACSVPCGGGTQTDTVTCTNSSTGATVANANCTGPMPATSQACNPAACAAAAVTAFGFVDQKGVGLAWPILSNTVTLAGGFTNATASCNAGCIGISINGAPFSSAPVTGVNSGDTISIEQFSSASSGAATTASVTVGATTSSIWTATTGTTNDIYINSNGATVWAINMTTHAIDKTITMPCTTTNLVHTNSSYGWLGTNSSYEYVLCTNGNIYAINTGTYAVSAAITGAPEAWWIFFNPAGTQGWILNVSKTVYVLNTATNKVTSFSPPGAGQLASAVFDSAGTYAYVTDATKNVVYKINASTDAVVATVATGGSYPSMPVITPDGTKLYVSNQNGSSVAVIDLATFTLKTTIGVGNTPEQEVFDSTGAWLYVANLKGNSVSVINTSTDTVSKTLTGITAPNNMAANKSYAYAQGSANSITVINTSTNTVVTTPAVGKKPDDDALNPGGTELYVPNSGGDSISVINTSSNTVTDTIGLGTEPSQSDGPFYIP